MKKLTGLILALLLIVPGLASAEISDGRSIHSYYLEDLTTDVSAEVQAAAVELVQADIITGYKDGTLRPNASITRAEFIMLLVAAAELQASGESRTFTDVKAGAWYTDAIQIASSLGIISGDGSGTFRPNDPITRIEISKILVEAFKKTIPATGTGKQFTDVSGWEETYSKLASSMGISNGNTNGTFSPKETAKRGHAILMLHRALNLETGSKQEEIIITSKVKEGLNKAYEVLSTQDYEALDNLTTDYSTAFYRQSMIFLSTVYEGMRDDGSSMAIELVGTPAIRVLTLSKRYASVEVTGYSQKITLMVNGLPYTDTSEKNDILLLKKMGGSWYIYGSQSDYENVNHFLELLK